MGTPGASITDVIPHGLTAVHQDKLQSNHVAINISLYCDGTQLNSFGTKKACGVYLWINNYPRDIRMSRTKKGGAILVGYIPEVRCPSSWCVIAVYLHSFRLQESRRITRLR